MGPHDAPRAGGTGAVRWGILSTGGMAAAFAEALRLLPDAELVAVGSRSQASARRFAERYGVPRAYGTWAGLAADPDVDVVHVATPHPAHHAAAGLCLEAGKHVLCEKPFTVSAAEAADLVRLARERGLFLMEAMWTHCLPTVRRIAALVRDGAIGDVRCLQADLGFVAPADPAHRLRDPAAGGGALLDVGVYPVSLAHLLLGPPGHVAAWAALTPEGVDGTTGVVLGHDGGAVSTLTCSIVADTPGTVSITGATGRIDLPDGLFSATGFTLHRRGGEPEEFRFPASPGPGYHHEAAEVMRCLRAGETESPLVPLEGTLAVMATLDTIRERIGVRHPGEAVPDGAVPDGA
ncbi:Gfo/Idh/MocA family protein [Streptomyces chilikensis]|uniref:Gfo/Idh/MocA family protein n=1 Tax=Streptomyces chilikensis TaxID=1194079 RepID=UPI0014088E24|nr:Gfo/Idh/MocA family oxidoreductase [Streptomyces chilikensis]